MQLVSLGAQQHPKLIHQHIFSRLASAQLADCIIYLTTQRMLFRFLQTITFSSFRTCLSFIISGHVSFLMFHLIAIFPSQCVLEGSAERSTSTFLVAWPVQNLLIAWPISPYRHFCFGFYRLFHFCQFSFVWIYLIILIYWHSG